MPDTNFHHTLKLILTLALILFFSTYHDYELIVSVFVALSIIGFAEIVWSTYSLTESAVKTLYKSLKKE